MKTTDDYSGDRDSYAAAPKLAALSPQITMEPIGNGTYSFSFAAGGGGVSGSTSLATLREISRFSVELFDSNNERIDSLATTDIHTSGTMNSETRESSLIASAGVEWNGRSAPRQAAYAVATIHMEGEALSRRLDMSSGGKAPPERAKPIVMTLDVNSRGGGGAEFILRVRRVGPAPEGEYVPTSERFRIVLQDDVGEEVWSSSRGRAFAQVVGQVEPTEIGKEIEYRIFWNGRDERTHSQTGPGVFRIMAMLPAKPTPYVLREEFTWSGR